MTAWETIREAPRQLREAAAQARPQLRSIAIPPRRLSPLSFAALVVGLFVAGMIGMLALTTMLQNQAFAVRDAQRTASELGYRASDLEVQVNRAKSPALLGRRAADLGMVPNPHGVFIDLSTGEVLGEPIAARGDEIPSLTRRPVAAAPEIVPASEPQPAEAQPAEAQPAETQPAAEAPPEEPAVEAPPVEAPPAETTADTTADTTGTVTP